MRKPIFAVLVMGGAALSASRSEAADVRVLTNPAYRPVLDALAPQWEKQTGHHVVIIQAIPADLLKRITGGETFDIAVANPPTVTRLKQDGKVDTVETVAAVGISIAIRSGSSKPDISTVPAFKAALLAAPSLSMADPSASSSSGNYMMQVFDKLGITADMKPKLVIVYGGSAGEPVSLGKAEMAVQQASELFDWANVDVIGPIPPELQSRTLYLAGLSPTAGEPARSFYALLASAQARTLLESKPKGMEAP